MTSPERIVAAGSGNRLRRRQQDPRASAPLDGCWYHAGNYDSRFQERWSWRDRVFLPLSLLHLGNCGQNWCGRAGAEAMAALRAERIRRRGWQHETIANGGGR